MIEVVTEAFEHREELRGYRSIEEAPMLRHFTAKFEPVERIVVKADASNVCIDTLMFVTFGT